MIAISSGMMMIIIIIIPTVINTNNINTTTTTTTITGNMTKVRELVEDGDFYDPMNIHKLNEAVDGLLDERDEVNAAAEHMNEALKVQDGVIRDREDILRAYLVTCAEKDVEKEAAEKIMDAREMTILTAVKDFEACTADMHQSDLEEIFRMRKPVLATRLASGKYHYYYYLYYYYHFYCHQY